MKGCALPSSKLCFLAVLLMLSALSFAANNFTPAYWLKENLEQVNEGATPPTRQHIVYPDGSTVTATNFVTRNTLGEIFLVKRKPDGVLDNEFGEGGLLRISDLGFLDVVGLYAIEGDSLGRLLLSVAISYPDPQNPLKSLRFNSIVRLNPGGGLDASFGSVGAVALNDDKMVVQHIRVDSFGRIYVGGYTKNPFGTDIQVVRLTDTGEFDLSYANGGVFIWVDPASNDFSESLHDMEVESGGELWIAGGTNWASWRPFVVGVSADGVLSEQLLIPPKDPAENILDIDLVGDKLQLVVAIDATYQSKYYGEIWRLNSDDLSFDSSFGDEGKKGILLNENNDSGRPFDCELVSTSWVCSVNLYQPSPQNPTSPGPGVSSGTYLAKYDVNFNLDLLFGDGGYLKPESTLSGVDVEDFRFKLNGDDIYLVGRSSTEHGRLYQSKYINFELDTKWGEAGEVELGRRFSAEQATGMARNGVGITLISGIIRTWERGEEAFLIIRNPDGSKDTSFADSGFLNLSEFDDSGYPVVPAAIEPINDDLFVVLGKYSHSPEFSGGYALFLVSKSGQLVGGGHVKKAYQKFFSNDFLLPGRFVLEKRQDGGFAVGYVLSDIDPEGNNYLNVLGHEFVENTHTLPLSKIYQEIYSHPLELLSLAGAANAEVLALIGGEFLQGSSVQGVKFDLGTGVQLPSQNIIFDLGAEYLPLNAFVFPGMDATFLSGWFCNEANSDCEDKINPFVSVVDSSGGLLETFNSGQPLVFDVGQSSLGVDGAQLLEYDIWLVQIITRLIMESMQSLLTYLVSC